MLLVVLRRLLDDRLVIPFDPKAITLLVGPPACGKTTALVRMAASMEMPWYSSYESSRYDRMRQMRRAGRSEYYDVLCIDASRAIHEPDLTTLFLDSVEQIVAYDLLTKRCKGKTAAELFEYIIVKAKEGRKGLVMSLQGSRDGRPPPKAILARIDHVWTFPQKLTARCARGPHEGTEIVIPPLVGDRR